MLRCFTTSWQKQTNKKNPSHLKPPRPCSQRLHFADYLDFCVRRGKHTVGQSPDRSILPIKAINPVWFALIFAVNTQTGGGIWWGSEWLRISQLTPSEIIVSTCRLVSVIKRDLSIEADYCWAEGVRRSLGHLSPQPICIHIPLLMQNAWKCSLCSRMESG